MGNPSRRLKGKGNGTLGCHLYSRGRYKLTASLDQWFSTRGDMTPPRDIWQSLEGVAGLPEVGSRNAANA